MLSVYVSSWRHEVMHEGVSDQLHLILAEVSSRQMLFSKEGEVMSPGTRNDVTIPVDSVSKAIGCCQELVSKQVVQNNTGEGDSLCLTLLILSPKP